MASPLVVNVAELLREPGARKHVAVAVTASELDVHDRRIDPDSEVRVDVTMGSSLDGIVAHGVFTVEWHDHCRRCARAIAGTVRGDVEEVFQQRPATDDASPITGEQIDLRPVVRDLVLLEVPDAALCHEDCAGLCPMCGADLNEGPCGCTVAAGDERWAALDQLRGDLG